jgi:hypothetical protein
MFPNKNLFINFSLNRTQIYSNILLPSNLLPSIHAQMLSSILVHGLERFGEE